MSLFETKLLKIGTTAVLSVSIVTVVAIGQLKMSRESKRLQTVLAKAQTEVKKPSEEVSSTVKNNEKPAEVVNEVKYKGASSLGLTEESRWKGKNWYAVGDNITAGNGYQNLVKTSTGISTVKTEAATGLTMAQVAEKLNTDIVKSSDIITIFAGTSDYSLNTKKEDFKESVHKVVKKIIEVNPDATIVFFTPMKRGAYKTYTVYPNSNAAGVKLDDYAKIIKDVCKEYNILVLDLLNKSGIDEKNIKDYTVDNLNLNWNGFLKVSKVISDYLKTISK